MKFPAFWKHFIYFFLLESSLQPRYCALKGSGNGDPLLCGPAPQQVSHMGQGKVSQFATEC